MQEMENINKDDKVPTSRAELGVETLSSQCNEQSSTMRAEMLIRAPVINCSDHNYIHRGFYPPHASAVMVQHSHLCSLRGSLWLTFCLNSDQNWLLISDFLNKFSFYKGKWAWVHLQPFQLF